MHFAYPKEKKLIVAVQNILLPNTEGATQALESS